MFINKNGDPAMFPQILKASPVRFFMTILLWSQVSGTITKYLALPRVLVMDHVSVHQYSVSRPAGRMCFLASLMSTLGM